MNDWRIFYIRSGKPHLSRPMRHAKAMVRYMKDLESKAEGDTISLMKVVATNKVPA